VPQANYLRIAIAFPAETFTRLRSAPGRAHTGGATRIRPRLCRRILSVERTLSGLDVTAFIAHLNRAEDPEYRAELDRRMADMDSGRKTTAGELERLHEDLSRKGR